MLGGLGDRVEDLQRERLDADLAPAIRAWIEAQMAGRIVAIRPLGGGNRRVSLAVDVETADGRIVPLYLRHQPAAPPSVEPYSLLREASVYAALAASGVKIPQLFAVNAAERVVLTERVSGEDKYRRLTDRDERDSVALDFIRALASLHRFDASAVRIGEPGDLRGRPASVRDCVADELAIWTSMYRETDRTDPLIELALRWLQDHLPDTEGRPILVHGDAGPGNFLFENGKVNALLDWEFAHFGDPMEDLAWFSLRNVMEPVPDFAAILQEYERLSSFAVDPVRLRYHRVFVCTRIVIIRHRDVIGLPAHSIVSRALNRRLLVASLQEAAGYAKPTGEHLASPPTDRTGLFNHVIESLRQEIAERSGDEIAVFAAKNAAKVVKYLREIDRYSAEIDEKNARDLAELFQGAGNGQWRSEGDIPAAISSGAITFQDALAYFTHAVGRQSLLAADASGRIAGRDLPDFREGKPA